MSVYRFGEDSPIVFDAAHPDFRSDAEQRYTPLAIYDNDNEDIRYARQLADEQINVAGAEVLVYIRTDNHDYDAVWDEDPDPTYWNKVSMKAFFPPTPLEVELKEWGLDTANATEVTFSHMQIYKQFGQRMLRSGDVIRLPYGAPNISLTPQNYRVLNGTPSGNYKYAWLYFKCTVQTLTADVTVRPDDTAPMHTDVDSGTYREAL